MDYDLFDYRSSHDSSYYDDLIDQYEHYSSFKDKKTKQKQRYRVHCAVSMKNLKSNAHTVKRQCFHDEKTPKAQPKKFRYDRLASKWTSFDCDQLYDIQKDRKSDQSSHKNQQQPLACIAKNLQIDTTTDFPSFQRDFYQNTHHYIKSSCNDFRKAKITNIRPAPIDPFVQKEFMSRLRERTSPQPYLVFHGTAMRNFESILRFGFLIPNRKHPTNPNAPMISMEHGQSYGIGIYSSLTLGFSMGYNRDSNTLFACAALPHQRKGGQIARQHGTILVLPSESRIIPLFLVDFIWLSGEKNHAIYAPEKQIVEEKFHQRMVKPKYVTRKYLRKALGYINDELKNKNRYQIRSFDF